MAITISAAQYRDRNTVEWRPPAVVSAVSGSVAVTSAAPTVTAVGATNATVPAVTATVTATAAPPFILGATKPDATNTGVQTTAALTVQSSDLNITSAGTTIQNLDVHGFVTVNANNVTIRNCRVRGRTTAASTSSDPVLQGGNQTFVQSALILVAAGVTGTLIEYCETGTDSYLGYWQNGISGAQFTARRCNVHDTVDAFDVNAPGGVTIEGCYVHDLSFSSTDGDHKTSSPPYWTHNDGVQIKGGDGTTIRGNNFVTYASQVTSYDPNGFHTGTALAASPGDPVHPWLNYGAGVTIDNTVTTNTLITLNWFEGADANFQCNVAPAGNTNLGEISYNRFGRDQHIYPGSSDSRYQIRYATGWTITGGSTNYWDNLPSVPVADVGQPFAVGYKTGIRSP